MMRFAQPTSEYGKREPSAVMARMMQPTITETMTGPTSSASDMAVPSILRRVFIGENGESVECSYASGAFAASTERSDPYFEWALRFHQDLNHFEDRLLGWARDPASLADDDFDPPSRATISMAIEIVRSLKVLTMDRVAPDNATRLNFRGASVGSAGEISLELAAGPSAETYRIETDGTVTRLIFSNHRLVRQEMHPR